MSIKADDITRIIREQLGSFSLDVDVPKSAGCLVCDGIAACGRGQAMSERSGVPNAVRPIALNLEMTARLVLSVIRHSAAGYQVAHGRIISCR